MDTVTYPNPGVERILAEHVVPVRLNTVESDPDTREAVRRARAVWTPTLLFFDHHGIEVRREVGSLGPDHFVAVVGLALGQAQLLHGEFDRALDSFDRVAQMPDPHTAAEGLYWAGVAGLRQQRRDLFTARWTALSERFPDSTWWERASFIQR